jgi:diaminohydroxyphosphoribosylaminopyrimidine deaminase/5-amino-6-(5-phosphoribosylamino)uracil reductase
MRRATNPSAADREAMRRAIEEAEAVRGSTSPNPWVGAVVWGPGGEVSSGATSPPGGPHAEVVALQRAGDRAHGATLCVTLEPCAHHGRTPPCTEAIIAAGVSRVVFGVEDPDQKVSGRGAAALREAGIELVQGVMAEEVAEQLAAYLKHRRTGRPWVVLKLAATLDGRIAAPDGSSRWITGDEARQDAHRLRARSDAIVVGAGTVRADDPSLTARPGGEVAADQPLRVVLGRIPEGAKVLPAVSMCGDLEEVLDDLGGRGVLQVLVEGGSRVAHAFHSRGLVDRYVVYLAPAIMGGDDGVPMMSGPGAGTMADVWRGRFVSVERVGLDIKVEVAPDG